MFKKKIGERKMSFSERMKGVWEKLKDFWATNMERDHRVISRSFGAFIILTILAVFSGFSLMAMGGDVNWSFIVAEIIGALGTFLVILFSCFFGNDRKNGNGEKPDKK